MLPNVPQAKREEFNKNLEDYTLPLNDAMKEFEINKPTQQAMFLATLAEESKGLTADSEDPSKHPSSKSRWKGRGPIQLTGRRNYRKASDYFKVGDLVGPPAKSGRRAMPKHYDGFTKNPDLAADPQYSYRIAAWYWTKYSNANSKGGDQPAADLQDFRHASGLVNSGKENGRVNGWGVRVQAYRRALEAFGLPVSREMSATIEQQSKVKDLIPPTTHRHRRHRPTHRH